jgi:hypothetical protein
MISTGVTNAALVIHEPFAQTAGSLLNKPASSTGLTGNYTSNGGSGNFTVTTGTSLSYGSQTTSGGQVSYVAPNTNSTGNISHSAGIASSTLSGLLDDGDVLWFSVLQRTTNNTSDDRFAFALSSDPLVANTNFGAGQGVGFAISNTGNLTARISTAASTHSNGASIDRFSLQSTILIVGRITFGTTDTMDLFLPGTNMDLGSVQSTVSAAVDQSLFDTVTFHTRLQGSTTLGANTDVGLDEIRFGTTQADVLIPEPSSALLGGLGLLVLLRRRR